MQLCHSSETLATDAAFPFKKKKKEEINYLTYENSTFSSILYCCRKKKKHIYNKEKKRSLLMPYLKISLSNVKYKLEWKDIIHWTDYD